MISATTRSGLIGDSSEVSFGAHSAAVRSRISATAAAPPKDFREPAS